MESIEPFKFERTRGIVWVCDIERSSAFLNDPDLIDDIESFLPRFYYVSKLMVETFGGEFLKWTGDGFLAFFKVELERDLLRIAEEIFEASFHLSFISKFTKMGLNPKKEFLIRHGITYEKDALLMKIQTEEDKNRVDIIGRAVVLAFRLSSVRAHFPSIVTVKELVQRGADEFIVWKPTIEEKLRFFKGEKYGTDKIRISGTKEKTRKDLEKEGKLFAKKVSSRIEKVKSGKDKELILKLIKKLELGPSWCKEISKILKNKIEPIVDSLKIFNEISKRLDIAKKNNKM